MIMTNKEKDTVALYCNCGMTDGVFLKVEKDQRKAFGINGIDISLVSDNYYLEQYYSKTKKFKEKLKRIWNIIKGEEYYYFNIWVDPEDIKEFKEFVAQI